MAVPAPLTVSPIHSNRNSRCHSSPPRRSARPDLTGPARPAGSGGAECLAATDPCRPPWSRPSRSHQPRQRRALLPPGLTTAPRGPPREREEPAARRARARGATPRLPGLSFWGDPSPQTSLGRDDLPGTPRLAGLRGDDPPGTPRLAGLRGDDPPGTPRLPVRSSFL